MDPAEKCIVARRAHGEYAVQGTCERIWRKYKTEKSIYTAFLKVVCASRKETHEEWKVVALPVIARHPDPFGVRDIKPAKVSADPPKQRRRGLNALKAALKAPWPTRDSVS